MAVSMAAVVSSLSPHPLISAEARRLSPSPKEAGQRREVEAKLEERIDRDLWQPDIDDLAEPLAA